jgi:hypothetical protein
MSRCFVWFEKKLKILCGTAGFSLEFDFLEPTQKCLPRSGLNFGVKMILNTVKNVGYPEFPGLMDGVSNPAEATCALLAPQVLDAERVMGRDMLASKLVQSYSLGYIAALAVNVHERPLPAKDWPDVRRLRHNVVALQSAFVVCAGKDLGRKMFELFRQRLTSPDKAFAKGLNAGRGDAFSAYHYGNAPGDLYEFLSGRSATDRVDCMPVSRQYAVSLAQDVAYREA